MHVKCCTCPGDFDLSAMPVRCPLCHQGTLLEIVDGDVPLYPWVLTSNDEKMMRDRGIAR